MSYLLDALRKAEHERKLGDPSALQQPPGWRSPLPALDRRWYLAILAFSAALSLLAAALLATRGSPDTAAETPPAPTAPHAPAAGGPRSFDELGVPPAPAVPGTVDDDLVQEAVPETAPAGPAAIPVPQPLKVAEKDLARTRPSAAPAVHDEVDPEPLADDASSLQAALDTPAPVAELREMPLEFRAGFPTPSIEVHVYEALPQRRWIMSGGKRYREGETLPQGQRIAEITPDSVIFDFRGQQARVPVGR